jgi:hypothetical protein
MATDAAISTTEILEGVVQPVDPSFAPEFARLMLGLRLSDAAQERVRELLQRGNAGSLEASEQTALDNYLLVGQFIDLLKAKTQLALQRTAS